jgi:hypothetical protein
MTWNNMKFIQIHERTIEGWSRLTPFLLAWMVVVAMALLGRLRDPMGRSPEHPGYGENLPGDFPSVLAYSAIELAVLALILRPWSGGWRLTRIFLATLFYVPYAFIGMIVTMHAGSILSVLVIWRVGIVLLLVVGSVGLGFRSLIRRASAR